ncbi:alginate lyase family protein [Cellulomonas composti]|uniref:Alginate lyase domain-containing protein n=1 Tax=Cellulomonas composti TaxID=266130 RepID=A0A511J9D1_9CELL|nr:alginate lyase family protein [Cellulomonas composti]GEL94606.1 hypothetical protein CCO02nite_12640 [Cellulomonas composti]
MAGLATPATAVPSPTPAPTPAPTRTATAQPAAPSAEEPAGAAPFVHPGVSVSADQLAFVREKLSDDAEPWVGALRSMMRSQYADPDRIPAPRAVVDCGRYSIPDNGCTDELTDAGSAYTLALAWTLTGQLEYLQSSIRIMDAWSGTVRRHTGANAWLQSAWTASMWTRAAELVRYSTDRWPAPAVERFASMLRNAYLPYTDNLFEENGNWELTMLEATVGTAVFLDDEALYERSIERYLKRVKAYVYLPADGSLPYTTGSSGLVTPPQIVEYWHSPTTFVAGLAQETCRDLTHTEYGLAAAVDVAQTATIQGRDVYAKVGDRLVAGLELASRYTLEPPPVTPCGAPITGTTGRAVEAGYNALHNRLGHAMPFTARLVEQSRPSGSGFHIGWQTLTDAENPWVVPQAVPTAAAPEVAAVVPGAGQVALRWRAVPYATGYQVQVSTAPTFSRSTTTSSTAIGTDAVLVGLRNATPVWVRLRAAQGRTSAFTVPVEVVPRAVAAPRVQVRPGTAPGSVTWDLPARATRVEVRFGTTAAGLRGDARPIEVALVAPTTTIATATRLAGVRFAQVVVWNGDQRTASPVVRVP